MEETTLDHAEELPSLLWGLDPVFSAFARLHIFDVLQMTESRQVPGIYFYNSHPIYKVDVLGTVVYKREREDFLCYGVDDGTGVINCICWKNDLMKQKGDTNKEEGKHSNEGHCFNPVAELKKLRQAQQRRCLLEIGDLLRVRGPVKTFRKQREIIAYTSYQVDDPLMTTQITWMFEVLELYRLCYDKPLQLPQTFTSDLAITSLSKAVNTILDFFKQKSVTRFRPYDVVDILQPLVSSVPPAPPADVAESVPGPSESEHLWQLLREALHFLQDNGIIYRKIISQDEVYLVTAQDKELLMAVKDIIREDSKRDKYMEKGCHFLYILSAVRQSYSLNLSKAMLKHILKSLECDSDIVSLSDNHYSMF